MFTISAKSIETGISERKRLRRALSPHTKQGRRIGSSRFPVPGSDRQITLDWDVVTAFEYLFYRKPDEVHARDWGCFEPAVYFQLPRLRCTREFSVVDHMIVQAEHRNSHGFQKTAEKRIDPGMVIDLKLAPTRVADAIKAMIRHIYEATNGTTDFDWTMHPIIDVQTGHNVYWEEMAPGPGWIVIRRVSGVNLDFAMQERAIPFREGMTPWVFLEPNKILPQKMTFDHKGDEAPTDVLSLPSKEPMPLRLDVPEPPVDLGEVLRPLFNIVRGEKRTHDPVRAIKSLRVGQTCELHLPNVKAVYNAIAQSKEEEQGEVRSRFKVTRFDTDPRYFWVTRQQ